MNTDILNVFFPKGMQIYALDYICLIFKNTMNIAGFLHTVKCQVALQYVYIAIAEYNLKCKKWKCFSLVISFSLAPYPSPKWEMNYCSAKNNYMPGQVVLLLDFTPQHVNHKKSDLFCTSSFKCT